MSSVIDLNSRIEHKSLLTTEEKIEWLNSREYDKKIDLPESDSYSLGRLMSNISLKRTKEEVEATEKAKVQEEEITEEKKEEAVKKEDDIEAMKAENETLKLTLEELSTDIKQLVAEINLAKIAVQKEEKELEEMEEKNKYTLKAFELYKSGEENIRKLDESIEASTNKLISLANQWEEHRAPLIENYREEKEKYSSKAVSTCLKNEINLKTKYTIYLFQ